MPATITVVERTRRRGEVRNDTRTYERLWYVWKRDNGPLLPMDIGEVFTAMQPYAQLGSSFPGLSGVKLVGLEPELEDDSERWVVTGHYEIPEKEEPPDDIDDFMQQSQDDNPENPFGPKFSGGVTIVEESVTQDRDNNPCVNSAGDPFETPLTMPITIQVDRVTVNEREKPDTSRVGTCQGRKLYADCQYQSAEHVNKETGTRTTYYQNTYEVWKHPLRDWSPTLVLDRGFRMITQVVDDTTGPGGKMVAEPVRDQWGEPVQAPVPLDGAGKPAAPPPMGQPFYLRFKLRPVDDLNVPFLS